MTTLRPNHRHQAIYFWAKTIFAYFRPNLYIAASHLTMFATAKKYVSLKVYQYELTTSLYMLEPWEKTLFNSIIIVGVSLCALSAYHYTPALVSKVTELVV
ncbi:hypothetical protein BC938DRAFT_475220 [Jimgerdemannia flammicorona]|uniref:Uncharacterized protein n=1 Tax=Jimgerdemannia flammicorona TaxID=994334 RepID=A0A433PYQ0_9FUNG|nr:hypothetical protein BC938DRAFT_475220 [Jimgerdemannia flammicorona]